MGTYFSSLTLGLYYETVPASVLATDCMLFGWCHNAIEGLIKRRSHEQGLLEDIADGVP